MQQKMTEIEPAQAMAIDQELLMKHEITHVERPSIWLPHQSALVRRAGFGDFLNMVMIGAAATTHHV